MNDIDRLRELLRHNLSVMECCRFAPVALTAEAKLEDIAREAGLSSDGPHDDPDFYVESGVRFALWLLDNPGKAIGILEPVDRP